MNKELVFGEWPFYVEKQIDNYEKQLNDSFGFTVTPTTAINLNILLRGL